MLSRFLHLRPCALAPSLLAALLLAVPLTASAQTSTPPTFADPPDDLPYHVRVTRGSSVIMWFLRVAPGTNPSSRRLAVFADATGVGGGFASPFNDQGFACDNDTTDLVFFSCLSVPVTAPVGISNLPVTVMDEFGRSSQRTYRIQIDDYDPAVVDKDGDGLFDSWEHASGLDATSAVGDNGAGGDPDGDGQTNAQELTANTHPRGTFTRYFAEGAANTTFATRVSLFNPGTETARVALIALGANGQRRVLYDALQPGESRSHLLNGRIVADTTFSILLESDRPVVADRVMGWPQLREFGRLDARGGFEDAYGTTLETATEAPSTSWYLAEGATGGPFSLFYLLQNPGTMPAQATVTYLRAAPLPPIVKSYDVPASGRLTIGVAGEDAGLLSGEVSAKITSDQPIVVERSMYYSTDGQLFTAGHAGAGIAAPATRWFFAEGATGFFDEFVLIANAEPQDAQVTVKYLLPEGDPISETITVAAQSRTTIGVNARHPALASTPVSVIIESAGVPVIAERVMWWPHGQWYEASLSHGAIATGTKWAFAAGDFSSDGLQSTYVQIANTEASESSATVTVGMWSLKYEKTVTLPANSRTTVDLRDLVGLSPFQFTGAGVTVTSPAQIVVERSMYNTPESGPFWSAGAAALATRLQ